ncbi:MAG: prepilin peptidase [Candidatus Nitrotoga sp.]|nr:prepilin peptidase [Candidatus Nitrotoga sp.]
MIFALSLLLLIAAYQDCKSYHIRNELVITGTLLGIILNSAIPGGLEFLELLIGWSIGLLLLLPLYSFRIMGAGDVKLMSMIGVFVGPEDIFGVFLSTLIAGGVLALIISLHKGMLRKLIDNLFCILKRIIWINNAKLPQSNLPPSEINIHSISKLPYAVAIATGTTIFLVINYINIH